MPRTSEFPCEVTVCTTLHTSTYVCKSTYRYTQYYENTVKQDHVFKCVYFGVFYLYLRHLKPAWVKKQNKTKKQQSAGARSRACTCLSTDGTRTCNVCRPRAESPWAACSRPWDPSQIFSLGMSGTSSCRDEKKSGRMLHLESNRWLSSELRVLFLSAVNHWFEAELWPESNSWIFTFFFSSDVGFTPADTDADVRCCPWTRRVFVSLRFFTQGLEHKPV